MKRNRGFSLVELLTVMVIVGLLASVTFLLIAGVGRSARIATCSASLHDVHSSLWTYIALHRNQFPPFAFSDARGDLPRSAHWIGQGTASDPLEIGRVGMQNVNLGALAAEKALPMAKLLCPGMRKIMGVEGLFANTSQWSSYGLRFPTSADLFTDAPELAHRGSSLLGIFAQAGGGYRVPVGTISRLVPVMRADRQYRIDPNVAGGDQKLVPWESALVSDAFWRVGASASPGGAQTLMLKNTWSHGRSFNVLYGTGSVLTVDDDGTMAEQTARKDNQPPAPDGHYYAKYAERVWQFFETARYNLTERPRTTQPAKTPDHGGEDP